MRTVWLGSAGTAVGYGYAKAIRKRWGSAVRIVAADINPPHLVAASLLADVSLQVPKVGAAEFACTLVKELRSHAVDTYIPILDEEIILAADLREKNGLPKHVELIAPPAQAARVCFDKWETSKWLSAAGIDTPATMLPGSARWNGRGVVVKPRRGRGSLNVSMIASEAEWNLRRESISDDYVVQELCDGAEVTVDTFCGGEGRFRASCRERLETKAGVCTKARVFDDPTLSGMARAISGTLPLPGGSCIQAMFDREASKWRVTDINPRLGAGTAMSAAVGLDFFSAGLAEAFGEDPMPFLIPLAKERFVVRQYEDFVTR